MMVSDVYKWHTNSLQRFHLLQMFLSLDILCSWPASVLAALIPDSNSIQFKNFGAFYKEMNE